MEVGEAENAVWPTTIEEFFHLGEHDTVNYVLLRRKFLVVVETFLLIVTIIPT